MLKSQNYIELRTEHVQSKTLFVDPLFRAEDSSIFYSKRVRNITWKRPKDIVKDPQFFVDGASRFDVKQGELGDCWLMAAMANLTLNDQFFRWVVPDDQSFTENYAGIFHFQIWQYGRWLDVVVDDLLPTRNGQLLFLQSHEPNEFWGALLEKAYAKIHGSYEALNGGLPCEALEDFTGGVAERYELDDSPSYLFQLVLDSFNNSSFMAAYILVCATSEDLWAREYRTQREAAIQRFVGIQADPDEIEATGTLGLIKGHAYSITCVKKMKLNDYGDIEMIRLRNPWGTDAEWKGPWSDRSTEWRSVSDTEKQSIGLTFDADGEFWMNFNDFRGNFSNLDIVHVTSNLSLRHHINSDCWKLYFYEDRWTKRVTAGGNLSYRASYHLNPQYWVSLKGHGNESTTCSILVALMQEYDRRILKTGGKCLWIGIQIFKVDGIDPDQKLGPDFFKENLPVHDTKFSDIREVSRRFRLRIPGTYVIVPSTYKPKQEARFILRIFTTHAIEIQKPEEATEVAAGNNCCYMS